MNLRPNENEYAQYYQKYVSLVGDADVLTTLDSNLTETGLILGKITDEKAMFRYADGKWSIKEMIGHIVDTERIFAYRALRFARNDSTELSGFEQDDYIDNADFDSVSIADLASEFESVRRSTLHLFKSLKEDAWQRSGLASGNSVSVRALAYLIAGHEIHHINILKERYLI